MKKKGTFDIYLEKEIENDPTIVKELELADKAIDISVQIFELRKKRGLTQAEFAKVLNISQSNVARLENADYEGYTMKTLEKIAKALKLELKIDIQPVRQKEVALETISSQRDQITEFFRGATTNILFTLKLPLDNQNVDVQSRGTKPLVGGNMSNLAI